MSSSNYYAVKVGRNIGIYRTWNECDREVSCFKGSKYKKFNSESEALAFIGNDHVNNNSCTAESIVTPLEVITLNNGGNAIFPIIHPIRGNIGNFDPNRVIYVDGGFNRFTRPHACGCVVDHFNHDLIEMYSRLLPDMTLIRMELPVGTRKLIQVKFSDVTHQNNGAELLATVAGLRIAIFLFKNGYSVHYLFSDSSLIVDHWSKKIKDESAAKMDPIKLRYVHELIQLTREFELYGGMIYKVEASKNPADLGYHRS